MLQWVYDFAMMDCDSCYVSVEEQVWLNRCGNAGILIYNGLADLLLPAFTSSRLLVGHTLRQLFAVFCMCAGFACMAFLAKWA